MAQLDGKIAIITGAASGIGKEIAKRFATEGATVVIADLQLPSAEATAAEINHAGGTAAGVAMDVSNEAAVDVGIATTIERFGRLDILVSNAGIQIVKPIDEFPFSEWKKLLAIHLDGAFLTTKACLRHMYQGAGGTIIYIGSVHSKGGVRPQGALRYREARTHWFLQGRRERGRHAWGARQRRMPRLRADTSGR